MKKLLLVLIVLTIGINVSAQTYSVRRGADGKMITAKALDKNSLVLRDIADTKHIYKAGRKLKMSGNFAFLSWGFVAVSGITYSGVATDERKICNAIGTICAVGAIITQALSINCKIDAGKELQLSATGIRLTF